MYFISGLLDTVLSILVLASKAYLLLMAFGTGLALFGML